MVAQVGCEGLRPGELGAIHKFAFTEVGGGVTAREQDAEPKPALL